MSEAENQQPGALPPKLNLRKLQDRMKPDSEAAKPGSTPLPSDSKTAKPPAARQATPMPVPLPKPGPAGGGPRLETPKPRQETVRLKPKLQPLQPATPKPLTPDTEAPTAPPPPATVEADAPQPPVPAPTSKQETSRIPLEFAQPPGTKTIRIKPVAAPLPITAAPAASTEQPAESKTPDEDPKRRTSRISLESALGTMMPDAEAEPAGPKTIRLKRPSEPAVAPAQDEPFSKTAPIAEVADEIPLTQKKTIKVKRPGQGPAARPAPVIRRPADADGATPAAPDAAVAAMTPDVASTASVVQDRAHWTFITFTIVTILVLLVTLYMLAAQAFGPNLSLTPLSYGADGMELPWPGRLYPR